MSSSSHISISSNQKLMTFYTVAGFLLISSVLVFLSLEPVISPIIAIAIIGIPFLAIIIKYPKVWIWSIATSSFMFFRASDLEITVADVLFGAYFIASIYIWLIWIVFIKREKIVSSLSDWLIIFFYIGMFLNVIVATLNGVDILNWFREYSLFSNILLYFPIKHYMRERKDIVILLLLFGLSISLSAADQLSKYREVALQEVQYAYQLGNSVRLNQTLFTAGIFFGLIMSVFVQKTWHRIALWVFSAISIGALVVSFSRSFWLFVIFGTILIFFYLSKQQKKTITIAIITIIIGSTIAFFSIFEEKAELMTQVLSKRILSSGQGTKDVSVQVRLIEYDAALDKIAENPFFGNGLGRKFRFYDPIIHITTNTFNIHNGYLFTIYRFGIPMALCFFVILGLFLWRSERLARKHNDPFFKQISIASMVTIMMMIVACMASNQFFSRDGGFVLAVSFALVSVAESRYRQLTHDNIPNQLAQ